MRKISKVVIHCSDSPDSLDIGFLQINKFHKEKGWKSSSSIACGYHYLIRRNGVIEVGRTIDEVGAHVQGGNFDSIGICLIGRNDFSEPQFESCKRLVGSLKKQYEGVTVHGHNEFPSAKSQGKTCPNFDIKKIL